MLNNNEALVFGWNGCQSRIVVAIVDKIDILSRSVLCVLIECYSLNSSVNPLE